MVSYFAYRCSLKPWIIKKLGNFQLENCYRDVTDPVMAQVIGAVRVPSEDGTGGTALIHDTQLRMTCNFTDSAIADFEKKELETSECEFSDLDDALIILERYRLVPTLFSVLNDCVFTVVVYSFRLKSFSKMGGDCSSTRMAHHHFRISKKLRELWGQWKSGDLAFITDESDSTGTVTDMTLSHTIRFMEDQMEAGSEDTPESCRSLSEPHKEDGEQPHVTTGRSDKSNDSRENDERDEREGRAKNPISLIQHRNEREELTTALFKVDMPTFKQMKCKEHEECILVIHHTSSHGDRTEDRPVDNDGLVEVLDTLPIMLYTSFPDDSNRDLPDGLYSWEVDAIGKEDTRDGDGRDEPKGCQAPSSSNSVVGPSESLSSECQGEGMVALKWPPSSPSVEESISANGTHSTAPPAADGDVSGRVESISHLSIQCTGQRLNVEAKTKETPSVDPDLSKSSSSDDTEVKNGTSIVEGTRGALIRDTLDPSVPVMSTTTHEEDLKIAVTRKPSVISGGNHQVKNHSNIVIPESSDSGQDSQLRVTTRSLSFERTATSAETETDQAEVIKSKEVGQPSVMTSNSSGKMGAVKASSSVGVTSKQSAECDIVDDAADGKNQEDSFLEEQSHLINDKGENINYESPSNAKIASGNLALFDKQVEISTKEKTSSLNERQREGFVDVSESEQTESSVSERDGQENAVTCEESPPLDLQNISKATPPSIVKCKEETSSAEGYDIAAGARFGVPPLPKEEEMHVSQVHSPTYPETQPFHVNSDEERYREYPETQMFEVEDFAQGDQKEANSSKGSADADWPPGTQPFDVIKCIASNATKDQEALMVSSADGTSTNIQGSQEINFCSFQDSPNELNKAFLQTQESQEKLMQSQRSQDKLMGSQESQKKLMGSQKPQEELMRSQNRTINLSQRIEKASIKQIRPRTCIDASLSPENEGQDGRRINSDSNESLEDIFLKPSEKDEEPQIPDDVERDVRNILHGALSPNEPLPHGDRSRLDDTVIPSGIKVQRKRKRNKVAINTGGIENEDLDTSQKQNKVRRKGSSLTMLGSDLPCGSISLFVYDKSLAGASPKARSELLEIPNKEEKRNRASLCEKFVEKLKDLKCSCGESISDDSHSSSCSPCWSHGTANCQTSEKISRVQVGSKDSELEREIAGKTTKSVAFGGDKPTDSNEPALSSPPLEVKATPKPKSNRKHRRMTREEAATSKRKLTEARFLRWLERNYGLQERRKKGKQTFDLLI